MSEYIRTNKFDTNECPNIFVKEKLIQMNVRIYICDQYVRIFEYIRHTLVRIAFHILWKKVSHACLAVTMYAMLAQHLPHHIHQPASTYLPCQSQRTSVSLAACSHAVLAYHASMAGDGIIHLASSMTRRSCVATKALLLSHTYRYVEELSQIPVRSRGQIWWSA